MANTKLCQCITDWDIDGKLIYYKEKCCKNEMSGEDLLCDYCRLSRHQIAKPIPESIKRAVTNNDLY